VNTDVRSYLTGEDAAASQFSHTGEACGADLAADHKQQQNATT